MNIRSLVTNVPGYCGDHETRSGFLVGLATMGVNVDADLPIVGDGDPSRRPITAADVLRSLTIIGAELKGGNTIPAIKELRTLTGMGLKECKDAIDAFPRGVRPPY